MKYTYLCISIFVPQYYKYTIISQGIKSTGKHDLWKKIIKWFLKFNTDEFHNLGYDDERWSFSFKNVSSSGIFPLIFHSILCPKEIVVALKSVSANT